jgi:8-oxo-dGTP diphosphatase
VDERIIWVTAGVIRQGEKLLVCQRKAGSPFALKWEFPGGKLEPGESPEGCLQRELREELGIEATVGPEIFRTDFRYPNGFAVRLLFFRVDDFRGIPENLAFEQIAWVDLAELSQYDFLEADQSFIQRMQQNEVCP